MNAAQDSSESQAEKVFNAFWGLLILCFVSVLLAIPAIWAVGPSAYMLLVVNKTHGKVYYIGSCDQGRVVFRDAQGQLQEDLFDGCDDGYATGETVAVWYSPAIPGDTVFGDEGASWLALLGAAYLLGVAVCLFFFLKAAWTLISVCMQAERFARLWQGGLACLLMVTPLLVMAHFLPPPAGQRGNGPGSNFNAGETVLAEGLWAVTVQTGTARAAEEAGTICLELEVTLRNVTGQARSLDVSQFTLFDGQAQMLGTVCSIDAPRLKDARVSPGGTLTGALSYRVPAGLKECYLAFQPGSPEENTGRYFWRLPVSTAGSGSYHREEAL